MSHDQNFKNLILDYPNAALDFFAAPEGAQLAEPLRIIPIRQEQLKERLGERFRELDVPLMVEWSNGEREALLFVLEHETQARRFSIYRLAHYCLDLAELFELDRVVPVVIFLNPGNYRHQLLLRGEQAIYLNFSFLACELAKIPVDHYINSANIVARLNLPNMSYASSRRVEVYAQAQDGLAALESNPEKRLKYVDFIDQYADLNDQEWIEYQEVYLPQSIHKETIMGLIQRSRDEGLQQGREEGIREGLLAGIELGLELKYGPRGLQLLPEIQQIQSVELLQTIREQIKTVDNPDTLRQIYHQKN